MRSIKPAAEGIEVAVCPECESILALRPKGLPQRIIGIAVGLLEFTAHKLEYYLGQRRLWCPKCRMWVNEPKAKPLKDLKS